MTCDEARTQLSPLLYGELSFDEEECLEQHLEGCMGCRSELDREKALHRAMSDAEETVPLDLLRDCRAELRNRIFSSGMRVEQENWQQRLNRFVSSLAPAIAWKPMGAVALVALGFFASRLASDRAFTGSPVRTAGILEPAVSRVRNIEPDATGGVQIVVDETRQRVLSGRIDDEDIRRLLLSAARDASDPGLRVESVDLLKEHPDSAEVRRALLNALQHDSNAGVRLKALEGLKAFSSDTETRKVLSQVLLTDDNPGVRTQAIDLLIQHREQDVVGVLQELLRKEDNGYVRLRSQKALRDMGASTETF